MTVLQAIIPRMLDLCKKIIARMQHRTSPQVARTVQLESQPIIRVFPAYRSPGRLL